MKLHVASWLASGLVGWSLFACGGLTASIEQAKQDAIDQASEAVQREVSEQLLKTLFDASDIQLGEDGGLLSIEADGIDIAIGPDSEIPADLALRPPDDALLFAAGSADTEDGNTLDFALADLPDGLDADATLADYGAQLEADGWTLQPLPESADPNAPKLVHAEKNGMRAIAVIIEAGEVGSPNAERLALLQIGASEEAAPAE